jgi:hypothetical protein
MSSKKRKEEEIEGKVIAYKSTIQTKVNEATIKAATFASNIQQTKSEALKQLNAIGDIKQRAQQQIKTTFDKLIDIFKQTIPNPNNSGSSTINFLIKQVLTASQNTKSRMGEIIADEVLHVAGCSEEQTFNPQQSQQKIYIKVSEIDLRGLLKNSPSSEPFNLRYEQSPISVGQTPFSMDKELYNRIQNVGVSFNQEYGNDYIGASGSGIFDIKYVTSYVDNGTTFYGDFYEITLKNRVKGNNIGDFLRDYYGSIDLINFDMISIEIMNLLTNFIDISAGLSVEKKEDQSRLSVIIQRILGLCFDSTREIDVQGTAKIGQLDHIDQSFFELTPTDLKNIEREVNQMVEGITEFTDCDNVKFPVDTQSIINAMTDIRNNNVDDSDPNKKIDQLMKAVNDLSKNQNWKLDIPTGVNLNLNVAINNDFLKIIPKATMFTILSPKMLLGMFIVLKAINPNFSLNFNIDSFKSFMDKFGKFMVKLMSKIAAIFIEELFKLIKKNIRLLVETLLLEIVKESKDKRAVIISSVIFILMQTISGIIDYRECNSLLDEILKLLNLGSAVLGVSIPSFALAASSLLGGFSPTRAMAEVTEGLQSIGIPTGDLPSGAPNLALPAISQQIKGQYQEQLANGKVEVFIPPLSVPPVVAGSTVPSKASGKFF